MSISTTQPVYYDYTQEFVDIKNSIDALTSAVLSVKASLDANSISLAANLDSNFLLETAVLQSTATSIANILNTISNPTVGVYTNSVDIPYQGLHNRALTRMALKDANTINDVKRAVDEERIAPMFNV
jgi:hypothetical protein